MEFVPEELYGFEFRLVRSGEDGRTLWSLRESMENIVLAEKRMKQGASKQRNAQNIEASVKN